MFRVPARATIGGMPPASELLVRSDWADDLPNGTVQDAARTHDAIAFAGWIGLAEAIRRLTVASGEK